MKTLGWTSKIGMFIPVLILSAQGCNRSDQATPPAGSGSRTTLVNLVTEGEAYELSVPGSLLNAVTKWGPKNRLSLTDKLWYPELRTQIGQAEGAELTDGFARVRFPLPEDWDVKLIQDLIHA